MNKKPILSLSTIITLILFIKSPSYAVCPVCTVAVGAGVGLSRYFGINDIISGIWIGALIVSMAMWTVDILIKRKIQKIWLPALVFLLMFALTVYPLKLSGIIGHPSNKILNMDKLLFGVFAGNLLFLLGVMLDKYLRRLNRNKVFFPYQKVVVPVSLLLMSSIVIYFL